MTIIYNYHDSAIIVDMVIIKVSALLRNECRENVLTVLVTTVIN
jgi:hypothetical protein